MIIGLLVAMPALAQDYPRYRAIGSTYVPLESWVYPALERLAALQYINSDFRGMKPWTRTECAGQIELTWERAAVAQIPGPPLGDYLLRLTAEGAALRFDLTTVRGRLQIAGAGELSSGTLRFAGEAAATGEGAAGLDPVLRAMGRPGTAPGRYLIEYRETMR